MISQDAMTFSNFRLIIDLQTVIPAFFINTWWEGISITHCDITMPTQVEEPYERCHVRLDHIQFLQGVCPC